MFEYNETLEQALRRNVDDALREDIGRADWTAQLVPAATRVQARVVAKESAVIAGQPWFDACVARLDPDASIAWRIAEGEAVLAGSEVCRITGDARALLSAERPALNFLQTLSGVATVTRATSSGSPGCRPIRTAARCSTPARRCLACASRRSTPSAWAAAPTIAWGCGTAS